VAAATAAPVAATEQVAATAAPALGQEITAAPAAEDAHSGSDALTASSGNDALTMHKSEASVVVSASPMHAPSQVRQATADDRQHLRSVDTKGSYSSSLETVYIPVILFIVCSAVLCWRCQLCSAQPKKEREPRSRRKSSPRGRSKSPSRDSKTEPLLAAEDPRMGA
jgi:hypothetical protein